MRFRFRRGHVDGRYKSLPAFSTRLSMARFLFCFLLLSLSYALWATCRYCYWHFSFFNLKKKLEKTLGVEAFATVCKRIHTAYKTYAQGLKARSSIFVLFVPPSSFLLFIPWTFILGQDRVVPTMTLNIPHFTAHHKVWKKENRPSTSDVKHCQIDPRRLMKLAGS